VTLEEILQEKEGINYEFKLLGNIPPNATNDGAPKLDSKQHRMWIAEML
jgi:hypothetical protein